MGIPRNETVYTPWSREEVEVLKDMYKTWPLEYDRLPGRTQQQVHSKAYRLGLTRRREVGPVYGHVTPTEWAYLAGLIDGEGTIHFWDGNVRRGDRTIRGARRLITITNTNNELVAWLREKFPESSVYTQVPAEGHWRNLPVHHVRWLRAGALREMLIGVMPYLIIKKEKAMRLLEHIESSPRLGVS